MRKRRRHPLPFAILLLVCLLMSPRTGAVRAYASGLEDGQEPAGASDQGTDREPAEASGQEADRELTGASNQGAGQDSPEASDGRESAIASDRDSLGASGILEASEEDEEITEDDYAAQLDAALKELLESQEYTGATLVEYPDLELVYDERSGWFRYMFPDGEYFEMNVPLGGWSRERVYLTISEGLTIYQVWHNGELISVGGEDEYYLEGSYEIVLMDNEGGLTGGYSYKVALTFHLYVNQVMNISHINVPMGLKLSGVVKDGVPVEGLTGQERYFHMEEDGTYLLEFTDQKGTPCWEMEVERDTTPPALLFAYPVDGQILTEPIDFQPSERNTQIEIIRNHEPAYASSNRIALRGVYQIEVSDQAGNVREYEFTLRTALKAWDSRLIIIPCVLLVVIAVSYLYWRRSIRVI